MSTPIAPLLFSVDLEEFRPKDPSRPFRRTPLPKLTLRYLELLRDRGIRATFFVVGEVARAHPNLIREIAAAGHEIGAHGDHHIPLDELGPEGFRRDLEENLRALRAAGAPTVLGFRAPISSLTESTAWAYPILRELGFAYSSSVIPAKNPLYGWPSFGPEPRRVEGILEIPITVARFGPLTLPFFSGTYCRVLPLWLIRRAICRHPPGRPLVGYFHPYDLDIEQEYVMSAGVHGRSLLNHLLYVGRHRLPPRLALLLALAGKSTTHAEYAAGTRST